MRKSPKFAVRSKRGMSNWTDGTPVFEVQPGRRGSLWVGLDEGEAWFWMTAAQARRLAHFLLDNLGEGQADRPTEGSES